MRGDACSKFSEPRLDPSWPPGAHFSQDLPSWTGSRDAESSPTPAAHIGNGGPVPGPQPWFPVRGPWRSCGGVHGRFLVPELFREPGSHRLGRGAGRGPLSR